MYWLFLFVPRNLLLAVPCDSVDHTHTLVALIVVSASAEAKVAQELTQLAVAFLGRMRGAGRSCLA